MKTIQGPVEKYENFGNHTQPDLSYVTNSIVMECILWSLLQLNNIRHINVRSFSPHRKAFLNQQKAVRVVTNVEYLDHCRPHFGKARIFTICSDFILTCVIYVYDNLQLQDKSSGFHDIGLTIS